MTSKMSAKVSNGELCASKFLSIGLSTIYIDIDFITRKKGIVRAVVIFVSF
jgi:hypothetical protein